MSRITLAGNVAGTGTFTIESPNSNTDRTLALPDASTTLVGTDVVQTLTNKTLQGGALTLGAAQSPTSGTFVDFTGVPSWAKRVTVSVASLSTVTNSVLRFQIGDAGGIETTGYTGSSSVIGNSTGVTINFSAGFDLNSSPGASFGLCGHLVLTLVSGNRWVASGLMGGSNGVTILYWFGGEKVLSDTLDRVRITTTGGTDTFDGGTVNVMWEG